MNAAIVDIGLYMWLCCEITVPDNLQVVNLEDGSVTCLTTGMLTVDSISADQLGLDSIDVQVIIIIIDSSWLFHHCHWSL